MPFICLLLFWWHFWRYCGCGHLKDTEHSHVHVQSAPWSGDGWLHRCLVCPCVRAT